MSRQNIVATRWDLKARWFFVTFHLKDGSLRTYRYDPLSGHQIEAGADPKNFVGVQMGADVAAELAEAAVNIVELLL